MTTTLAVVGAGTMGQGIAYAAIVSGFDTRLHDVAEAGLRKATGVIDGVLARSVELGKLTNDQRQDARSRLTVTTDLAAAVQGAGFIIESVPERIDVKLGLYHELDRLAPDAILASNTSSLSITEMASALTNPRRLAGMHFFNPVHKMKLVEIVRALDSSPETIATIEQIARQMGKETVVVRESAGFITSRVNAMIGNEAFFMLQEGVASAEDIDKALKLGLNHPMGPFELVDLVGLDTRLGVLQFLHQSLGDKYRPCPLLVQHVKAGRLGRKVGRGVYDYQKQMQ